MNTTYWINTIMSAAFGGGTTFYVGLSSTTPNANGGGVTEPSGGGYARVRVIRFTTPANGVVKNAGDILFPQSSNEWFPATKQATNWVLFDGSGSSANVLASGALTSPLTVSIDVTVKIPKETLCITLTDAS